MNMITQAFYDSQNGRITDPFGFMQADADVKRGVIADWSRHNARTARSFEDRIEAFCSDAQVGYAFLTPQLYRIEAEVYMTKYPSFDINRFMPVDSSGDMWDIGTVVYSMDTIGQAMFLSGAAMDMPFASNKMTQNVHNFHLAGIGYEWNVQEMQRAAKLGRSLSADKAKSADLAQQRFLYGIAMTGKNAGGVDEKGWTGFVNDAVVPAANLPADGTGASRLFSTKTPDQILRDVNATINAVESGSSETFIADSLALPTSIYNYLANTRVTDTGVSILQFLRANNTAGESLRIFKSRALETAGSGATTRMVAYANMTEVIRFHLPGPHRFLPPFQKASMIYEVGGIMNVGGVEIRVPKAMAYRDGA